MSFVLQLTTAGAALLNANTGPIVLTNCELGSAFNYIPQPSDTNIHGSLIFETTPSLPVAATANVVRYSIYLDYEVGPFDFGEVGFFTGDGTLFALGASNLLIYKLAQSVGFPGNSIRIDCYLSMVGQNYEMWLQLGESNNQFQMAVLGSPDYLPPSNKATPNAYIISGVTSSQSSFLAYTNQTGLWNFDAYAYANQASAAITSFDAFSVTIPLASYVSGMNPEYLGEVILEFVTGALYSICRYVSSAVISGNFVTLGFVNPLMIYPIVGDQITVFGRQQLSTTIPNLPIATTSSLGAVQIGTSLIVTSQGLLNINPSSCPVISVNGQVGNVALVASDIPGLATVATTGLYSSLIGAPGTYVLPIATTSVLGGVKASSNGHITVAGDGTLDIGFSPVLKVNSVAADGSGNVVVPLPPIATTSVPGIVSVGSGLAVTGAGVLSVSGAVTSFNSRTGAVTLTGSDITGAGGALLASPTFTGVPSAPTANPGTNSTQLASTAFVAAALAAISGNFAPLADFTGSFGNPGYFEIPIGGSSKSFIIQWGVTTIAAGVNVVVQTLPIAFTTAYLGGVASDVGVSGFSCSVSAYTSGNPLVQIGVYTAPYSCTTGAIEPHAVVDCTWIVIGY